MELLETRYLLGLGIGVFIVGSANWMAFGTFVKETPYDFFTWKKIKHDFFTGTFLVLGWVLTFYFLGRILLPCF